MALFYLPASGVQGTLLGPSFETGYHRDGPRTCMQGVPGSITDEDLDDERKMREMIRHPLLDAGFGLEIEKTAGGMAGSEEVTEEGAAGNNQSDVPDDGQESETSSIGAESEKKTTPDTQASNTDTMCRASKSLTDYFTLRNTSGTLDQLQSDITSIKGNRFAGSQPARANTLSDFWFSSGPPTKSAPTPPSVPPPTTVPGLGLMLGDTDMGSDLMAGSDFIPARYASVLTITRPQQAHMHPHSPTLGHSPASRANALRPHQSTPALGGNSPPPLHRQALVPHPNTHSPTEPHKASAAIPLGPIAPPNTQPANEKPRVTDATKRISKSDPPTSQPTQLDAPKEHIGQDTTQSESSISGGSQSEKAKTEPQGRSLIKSISNTLVQLVPRPHSTTAQHTPSDTPPGDRTQSLAEMRPVSQFAVVDVAGKSPSTHSIGLRSGDGRVAGSLSNLLEEDYAGDLQPCQRLQMSPTPSVCSDSAMSPSVRRRREMSAAGVSGFALDVASGLESSTFSLQGNLRGDLRGGLNGKDADLVLGLMEGKGLSFDEARHELSRIKMLAANIDPDTGLPLDPKAVSSLPPTPKAAHRTPARSSATTPAIIPTDPTSPKPTVSFRAAKNVHIQA